MLSNIAPWAGSMQAGNVEKLNMIKLVSIIFKVGGVVLLGATVGVFSHWRYTAGKESANTVWQSRWDKRNIADVELMARYQREAREEEQRRIKAIIQVNEDANLQLNAARADAARAKSVIISLRNTVRYMQQKLAEDNAAGVSATIGKRQAGGDSHLLLADMFAESLKRNQQLAAYADRARIRGRACERAYDAITQSAAGAVKTYYNIKR